MKDDDRVADLLAEWRERRERGEDVSARDLIRDHPDLAEELSARLAVLEIIDQAYPETIERPSGVPAEIGEFRILREIGRGGMGVVYEAEQTSLRRVVALKVLSLSVIGMAQAVKRFRREAQAASRLHHKNIVPVHAMGHEGGYWYYAMELVEGRSLGQVVGELKSIAEASPTGSSPGTVVDDSTPPPDVPEPSSETSGLLGTGTGKHAYYVRVAEMFTGVAEALEVAHEEGIVHRDIKPANLLLDAEGTLKIVDFGLARLEGEGPPMTLTGDLLGTPAYMSPEQALARREGIDHRTDIYSLGATMYEVLTLRPPFRGKTLPEICSQIINREPSPLRRENRHVPRDLETIVQKAMEKDSARRYRSAGEFARDLRRFAEGGSIRARRIGPLGRSWRRVKRNRIRTTLVAAVIVLAVCGALLAVRSVRDAERNRNAEYDRLVVRANHVLAHGPAWAGREGASRHLYPGASTDELTAAITLAPERAEAYWLRALHVGRTMEERFRDLDEALARGLTRRTYHLARAHLLRIDGQISRVREEAVRAKAHPASTPTDAFFEALLLKAAGRRSEALPLLRDAIETSALGSTIRYFALWQSALVREREGDLLGALEDLNVLRGLGESRIQATVRIASLWRRLGKGEVAEARFADALEEVRRKGSPLDWALLCSACYSLREGEWCERATRLALEAHGDDAFLMAHRASALSRANRFEEALRFADRALELDPDLEFAFHLRGSALLNLFRKEEALVAFDRALELEPGCPGAHTMRGQVLLSLGRCDQALQAIDRALGLDPGRAAALAMRGVALKDLGRHEEALAACDRALEMEPESTTALLARSMVLASKARHAEALESVDRALALDDRSANSHGLRGWILLALSRDEEALKALEVALTLSLVHPRAHVDRSVALGRLGRHEEAVAELRIAVRLDPDKAWLRTRLGICLFQVGRVKEALRA